MAPYRDNKILNSGKLSKLMGHDLFFAIGIVVILTTLIAVVFYICAIGIMAQTLIGTGQNFNLIETATSLHVLEVTRSMAIHALVASSIGVAMGYSWFKMLTGSW